MLNQAKTKYQIDQECLKNFTYSIPFVEETYKLFIFGGDVLELGKIFYFENFPPQKKIKGWGIFKGLKIDEKEIEEAKKSLFPRREF